MPCSTSHIFVARVQEFEYTPECCIFDLLHVRLYHGWLVEPSEPEVQRAVGQCGYNQLVDKIITNKSSNDPELSHQGWCCQRDVLHFYLYQS